jgi:hypothetical protein
MKYTKNYIFIGNDTSYKVFCAPNHGKVVKVTHIFKKYNASFFRTRNHGGRKFIHILTVCATLIWYDHQTTLQSKWTTVQTSSPTHDMPASYHKGLVSIMGQSMWNLW